MPMDVLSPVFDLLRANGSRHDLHGVYRNPETVANGRVNMTRLTTCVPLLNSSLRVYLWQHENEKERSQAW